MSVSGAGLCLTVLLTYVIFDTLVEGSSWRRHHGHHLRSHYQGFKDVKDSMSLDLLSKLSRSSEDHSRHHDTYRQRERHDNYLETAQANSFPSSEYEDMEAQRPLRRHRRRQVGQSGNSRTHLLGILHEKSLSKLYEFEVKEVQNSSVCSYTVVPIPDPTGSRVPKVLEHIKCNHAGSSCLGTNTHCCVQTYKKIEVSYGDGSRDVKKVYVGCVCAHQVLLQEQPLPIND